MQASMVGVAELLGCDDSRRRSRVSSTTGRTRGSSRDLPPLRRRARRRGRRAHPSLPPAARPARAGRLDRSRPGLDAARMQRGSGVGRRARLITCSGGRTSKGYPTMITDWRMTNLLASRFWPKRGFRADVPPALPLDPVVPRVPLLYGSRLVVVGRGRRRDRPRAARRRRPSRSPTSAPPSATRLRFPLDGPPLEAIVPRGGRVTILVEPPALPIPAATATRGRQRSSRPSDELERLGVPSERQTHPRHRRPRAPAERREIESARLARVRAAASAARSPCTTSRTTRLVEIGEPRGRAAARPPCARRDRRGRRRSAPPRRCCTAARRRCSPRRRRDAIRAAYGESLLETHRAPGWQLALALERALAAAHAPDRRVADARPAAARRARCAATRTSRRRSSASPTRRCARVFRLRPRACCARRTLAVAAARARPRRPPSPARRRSRTPRRSCAASRRARPTLDEPLDAICIGIPRTTPFLPRERPNPLLAADARPRLRAAALARRVPRRARAGRRSSLNPLPPALRPSRPSSRTGRSSRRRATGRDADALLEAERAAADDPRAIDGLPRGPHVPPAAAVRRLGLVPARRSTGSAPCSSRAAATPSRPDSSASSRRTASPAALEMARGLAGGAHARSASCSRRPTSR